MKEIKNISREAYNWLRNIPLEMWTLAHDIGCRYGVTTSNLVECFNNNIMSVRNLPITATAKYIYFTDLLNYSI